MSIKLIVVALLAAIVVSLLSGMFFMIRDKGKTTRAAKALTIRIALSVSLFGVVMLGVVTGRLKPHGIYPPGQLVHQQVPAGK